MNRIKTKVDVIYNSFVKKDIVIVHLSDIHFSKNTRIKTLNKLKKYIDNMKADYIMITGDTIDDPKVISDKVKIRMLVTFLTDIAKNTKVLIGLGNHDIINDKDYLFFKKLNDLYNIYVLNNSSYQDDYIYVSGITLPTEYYYNINNDESVTVLLRELNKNNNLINKLPNNKTKIVLIHSPIKLVNEEVMKKLKGFDLILCGHTHGGMVPEWLGFLFKNRGIVAPNKKIFPSIARGKIIKEVNGKKITIIINNSFTRLSFKSGKVFSKFNFLYNKYVNKIIIRKRRGIKYE